MLQENLSRLRAYYGFSQEEIAEKVGISRQAYARWESGRAVPDVEKCLKLAEIYGVSLDSLVNPAPSAPSNVLPAPKGKYIWGTVTLGDRGQFVIPKAAREHWHLSGGDRIVILSDDKEGFALIPAEMFEERMNNLLAAAEKRAD